MFLSLLILNKSYYFENFFDSISCAQILDKTKAYAFYLNIDKSCFNEKQFAIQENVYAFRLEKNSILKNVFNICLNKENFLNNIEDIINYRFNFFDEKKDLGLLYKKRVIK